jgi:hypothetical protein
MFKKHWRIVLRISLTIAAWIILIVYVHKLGHQYLGDIKSTFDTPALRIALQILVISILAYLIILSLPVVPTPGRRGIITLVVWATLLAIGHQLSHSGFHELQAALTSSAVGLNSASLAFTAFLYLVVLSLPFVPAIELGVLIMALFGQTGVVVAYVATVGGLCLSFAVARLLPASVTSRWMTTLGISHSTSGPDAMLKSVLGEKSTGSDFGTRVRSGLVNHRYLMLAACLNLPGNSVIGGGGGIALLCGLSGRFRWTGFVTTILLATAPIPILVFFGLFQVEPLLEKHGILHELLSFMERFLSHQ